MDLSAKLYDSLHENPGETILDFKGRFFKRGELGAVADRIDEILTAAGVPKNASVGVVARNRPFHAAALLGLIASGRALTTIYAFQSAEAIAEELATTGFAAVIADVRDWTAPVIAAAKSTGTLGLVLNLETPEGVSVVPGLETRGPGPFHTIAGEPGLEMLSSGTTGKPKRILFPFRMLVRAVESTTAARLDGAPQPDILTWPYGGIGGMCNLVASAVMGRYTALLDKFNVPEWVEAVRRLRPSYVTGPPAVARMVVDAKVSPEDVASIKYFFGGSAPMTPELQDEMKRLYDITVIWAYGATEFCGTIISWSPELHTRFAETKKGAMGIALPGIQLRVTDVQTGAPLPTGQEGYLEAIVPAVRGDEWIRTTDLVVIDEDGFVFHRGRGDGAIMRGGFKVIPERVAEALRTHPAVLDAAVIGIADSRLGHVPVAAVEVRSGARKPTEDELHAVAKRLLTNPQVPVQIRILDALPRTTSLKADLGTLRKMFESER